MLACLHGASEDVLIPSFSGLWLVAIEYYNARRYLGLNPFFFRSLVGHQQPQTV